MSISLSEFLRRVAIEFELSIAEPELKLVGDVVLDSLDLFRFMLLLETIAPGFDLPEQMDIEDVTLLDAYEYATSYPT